MRKYCKWIKISADVLRLAIFLLLIIYDRRHIEGSIIELFALFSSSSSQRNVLQLILFPATAVGLYKKYSNNSRQIVFSLNSLEIGPSKPSNKLLANN
jgi:hypothetical protein